MNTQNPVDSLLAAVPAEERDRLLPLAQSGAAIRDLTGQKPHSSALYRWARNGVSGVRLRTVTVGRCRYTTRRWLIDWFAAVDEARQAPEARQE